MSMTLPLDSPETSPWPRRLAVLGATGTVGRNTLDVVRAHRDRFIVEAVTANRNADALAVLARDSGAKRAIVADEGALPALRDALSGSGIAAEAGEEALLAAVDAPVDTIMAAIVGTAGLPATLRAVERGITVALANKECLVAAGAVMTAAAERSGARIMPVDSEHSAIFQALGNRPVESVTEVTLTASGGPFREFSQEQMAGITPEQAVKHPRWTMGQKISVDSATLMNKGLELIEAAHLFPFARDRLSVLVHPQSIVHGFVSFADGSVLAELGTPDMRTPIAVALAWPETFPVAVERLALADIARLDFELPDRQRFPALAVAESALQSGAAACVVLNAANEVAVAAFLARRLAFLQIATIVDKTISHLLGRVSAGTVETLDGVLALDGDARQVAGELIDNAA